MPITIERFAQVQARLDDGAAVDQVIAEEGLSEDVWRRAQQGWLSLIGAEVERRRFGLSQRYQEAYLAARPGLIGAMADRNANEPDALAGTSAGVVLARDARAALPFAAAGVAPPPVADRMPHSVPAGDTLDGEPRARAREAEPFDPLNATTADVTFSQLGAALPFGNPSDDAPPSSTLDPDPAMPPITLDVLPFSVRAPSAAALPSGAQPPPPIRAPMARVQPTSPGEGIGFGQALPFVKGDGRAPTPIADALPQLPEDALNQTTDGVIMSPFSSGAVPFSRRAPLPELTVDQYASLCAERRVTPIEQLTIAQRYGLASAADLETLDASWRARLDADAAARHVFAQKVEAFEAWLRSRREP
jgi:hypothetical protein